MPTDPKNLDLSELTPERREVFEALIARSLELEDLARRQEVLIAELRHGSMADVPRN